MEQITPNEAKKLLRAAFFANGLPDYKLTARTVSFEDLARASRLVITIHGWTPNPLWETLRAVAKENGFMLDPNS